MKVKLGSPTKQATHPAFGEPHLRSAFLRSSALWLSLSVVMIAAGVGGAPALADGGSGGSGATNAPGAGGGGFDDLFNGAAGAGVPGFPDAGGGGGGGGGGSGGVYSPGPTGAGGAGGDGSGGAAGGLGATNINLTGGDGAAGAATGGGGGGGGGFNGLSKNDTAIRTGGDFTGSGGGNGGAANGSGGGGGGGAGGAQIAFTSTAAYEVGIGNQRVGGAGGAGGASLSGFGGSGGTGGFGAFLAAGGTVNVGIGALLSGGVGGVGGLGGAGNGANGEGGAGIVGQNITIVNNGTIQGGLNGDGLTRANAITFTGGANTLTLGNAAAAIIGNIDTGGLDLTLAQATNSTLAANIIQNTGVLGEITKTGAGTLVLAGSNTFIGDVNIRAGALSITGGSNLGSSLKQIKMFDGATLAVTANATLASNFTFVMSGNPNFDIAAGTTTTIQGAMANLFGPFGEGSGFTKIGAGTLELAGSNSYFGPTYVQAGILRAASGSAFGPIPTVDVSAGATVDLNGFNQTFFNLSGAGTVTGGDVSISGSFSAGEFRTLVPGSSTHIVGNLAFQSGAFYVTYATPATSTFARVEGTATLGGATAFVVFADGAYVQKTYRILTATGGVSGAFSSAVSTYNAPSNFSSTLSYDANNVYLNTILNFAIPGGLNVNQQNVGNALTNFFNTTGGIPTVFANMSASGLSQASGETATGSQQTTFDAMTQFMGVMTDPFTAGRGTPQAGAVGYADETLAYAAKRSSSDALAAIYRKAPQMAPVFQERWSVWAAAFGGSRNTDGNTMVGSNDTRSSIGGVAVGADYWFSPTTLAGFSLAGGGTNFSVANGGSGRSDLFQAGAFVRHTVGSAYITAAAAYGWQDITTDRVVGGDRLRAQFNANSYSGRIEGGNRYLMSWLGDVGLTPYAAAQVTALDLPSYAETAGGGANTFALAYAGKTVTSTRSELGFRTDKSFAVTDAILTLRGRVAWAHDFNSDRFASATFQTLPGASFVVNGAAQARDAALTTASAELKWTNGWAVAGTFEGEFSDLTRSYAGKGVVRYAW
jgi:autotransporter-associated beta strand protein